MYKIQEKNVIPFITSFSNGTIHGYAGIFYVICSYLQNYELLKDYNILIYKKSQKGILDIIKSNHFISKGLISRKKVIKIHPNIKYLFNRMKFIPNKWHSYMFRRNFDKLKIDLISEHLFSSKFKFSFSRVAVIKSNINENNTSQGVFSIDDVNNLANKFELHLIKFSNNNNEIELANIIHQSNLLVLSWGTAFFKNYFYISNKCKR